MRDLGGGWGDIPGEPGRQEMWDQGGGWGDIPGEPGDHVSIVMDACCCC
jgi:hypothetical protein